MKNFDTVIFDLDGTLLNTLDDLADSVNYTMKQYGFPERTVEEVRCFVGNGVGRLIELSIPEGLKNPQYAKCLEDFRRHYAENMQNKTSAYEEVGEMLEELKKKGFKLAIVSNKFDKAVKGLNRIYFEDYVKVAIGESENVRRKPAPDSVFKALEKLGTSADKAIYVGDSEVDVQTAKNAGIPCVGVTWGFRSRGVLEQEGAEYIIDRPWELLKIVAS